MMNNLSFRTPVIYYSILAITLSIALLCAELPKFTDQYGFILITVLLVTIGIPHGATDHLVFNYLHKNKASLPDQITFYLFYVLSATGYLILWRLLPQYSILIFVAISIYHLGQSNLHYLSLPKNKILQVFIYSTWGLFVIAAPIASNYQEVATILDEIIGKSLSVAPENAEYLLASLILLNSTTLSVLSVLNYTTKQELLRETLNLCVLGLLFYIAPLMISFTVYFGFWHALSSILDQIQFIRKYSLAFSIVDLFIASIPLTIVTLIIFIAGLWFTVSSANYFGASTSNSIVSLIFIGLAAITIPHAFLRDRLYTEN